ncbi:unnamed protein product [Didymodactylos carnosus]|uniref:Uncharacterized protein n=1 Tax=Didymodactylos carnosus TaxID=1234261 RepID=A0A814YUS4_9BILA|nr:unnamed protein product [Didymodactylos carnosus]CAF1233571.1 unnamed protein product [Didymodactylos carnosus]CAF3933137.1 unnamed protein product [Didymodactylos carnosus]CAF3996155.1 unnamed protein product [Didymodactylos carnosus]
MNKIQLNMQIIPSYVKTSLRILSAASPRLIENLLPKTLGNIESTSRDCAQFAKDARDKFENVKNLLAEVTELTTVTQGVKTQQLKEVERDLTVSLITKEQHEKTAQILKQHYNEARETVRIAQTEYSKALKAIKTGWSAILQDVGRAFVGLVRSAASILGGSQSSDTDGLATSIGIAQSLSIMKPFAANFEKMIGALGGSKIAVDELKTYKSSFETFLKMINGVKSSSTIKDKGKNIVEKAVGLIEQIIGTVSKGKKVDKTTSGKLTELANEAKTLAAAETLNGDTLPKLNNGGGGDSSKNEKFKAELTQARLREAERRYDEMFNHIRQHQDEMTKLMAKIASLDITKINYQQLIELLRESIALLSRISTHWNSLVVFFSNLADQAETLHQRRLMPFIETTRLAGGTFDKTDRVILLDELKNAAVIIHKQSYKLFILSKTYVDISNKYFMSRLAGLSKMITAKDDQERNLFMKQLTDETETVQQELKNLAEQRKKIYHDAVEKKLTELDSFIQNLGGTDADDLKTIGEAQDMLDLE